MPEVTVTGLGISDGDVLVAAGFGNSIPVNSRRFRWLFCSCEVALDSSREALSSYTIFGSFRGLERKHEVAVLVREFCCAGSVSVQLRDLVPSHSFKLPIWLLSFCISKQRLVVQLREIVCSVACQLVVVTVASDWMALVSCITVVDFLPGCEGERQYRTLITLLGSLATMRRVVNYHSSWARQQQVELVDASGNPGSTACRGFNPAGGAPGGG
ncbi:hypothetical protein F511_35436 [Dorcoceras hygrometricum]|uniref:Uncharacterized protein n=1 Tax=Dorcoceras hygrometricum TaxID=472368 RepID=A0A2Z7DE81_9LAMI|nr:hypothetical protein F511_35436 [Dorcoceras hygrometricum]